MERAGAGAAAGDLRPIFYLVRLQGILCYVFLVGALFFINKIIKSCNEISQFVVYLQLIPLAVVLVGQCLYRACVRRDGELACARILGAVIELVRNLTAAVLVNLVHVILVGEWILLLLRSVVSTGFDFDLELSYLCLLFFCKTLFSAPITDIDDFGSMLIIPRSYEFFNAFVFRDPF